MPRRRRQSHALERVLGAPALFATAYGNVGSSIYYALGLTAGIALGLTPIVFLVSGLLFAAAWAQMLNYVITVAISVIFVPHYLSVFYAPLRTTPWDVILGIAFTWLLVGINIIGIREAARLNIALAVSDFATQL